MKRTPYTFSHRANGRYYWRRPAPTYAAGYEEVVSCDVAWFWRRTAEVAA